MPKRKVAPPQSAAAPTHALVWYAIVYMDSKKDVELVGVFANMEALQKYDNDVILAPMRKMGVFVERQWFKLEPSEIYIDIPPDHLQPGTGHQMIVRCKWNGGPDV